jgi:hypothetical protein
MKNNYRLESRMRENRPCGSEGGEGVSPFRPLSRTTSVVPLHGLDFDEIRASHSHRSFSRCFLCPPHVRRNGLGGKRVECGVEGEHALAFLAKAAD